MKICPTCQQQYPNGFQYCPTDTDVLLTAEEYLRRIKPVAQTPPPAAFVEPTQPVAPPSSATVRFDPPSMAPTQPVAPPPQPRVTQVTESPRQVQPPQAAPNSYQTAEYQQNQAPTARVTQAVPAQTTQAAPTPRPATGSGTGKLNNGAPQPGNGNGQTTRAIRPSFAATTADLSFAVPDQGSFFARLSDSLSNISESFKSVKATDSGDFNFLLKDESLVQRFGREFGFAFQDFQRDPKAFVVSLIKGEGTNKQRQRWILNGAAMAVITYSFLFFLVPAILMLVFGWWQPVALANKDEEKLEKLTDLIAEAPKIETKVEKPKEAPKGKGGFTGGSKPVVKQAQGGGGGGRQQVTPPSKGVPPPMALTPQIVMPNPEPPKIKNPSLAVVPTVYGDPKALPQMKGPIGDPLGVPAPPSSGPGKGAGIGTGQGTGVGRGDGGGAGAGRGGNAGGGDMNMGGGRGNGGSGGIEEMGKNGVGKPTILYKEKARYTEEARQNKVQGTVVLSVVFTADGRITSIRTVRGLPDGLTEKAIEAAQRIRFQPATKNGAPVSVRGNLEFSFNLY